MDVDWVEFKLYIVNRDTGKALPVHLFKSTLIWILLPKLYSYSVADVGTESKYCTEKGIVLSCYTSVWS